MVTKLSRFADGLMESAWLAAIILAPAFFNIYSGRIFEPDKIALLRSLALLILAGWIIKLYEEGNLRRQPAGPGISWLKDFIHQPLMLPVVSLALVYILSTLFSVTPQTSLWGSYPRLQGTYTTFSYLVIFASMLVNLRQRKQVTRLVSVLVITSLPVSLYGLLQRFQIDPIPWGGDVSARIASTLGNSIFVAAYLIMVFPLTLMRIVESFEALMGERATTLADFLRATSYVFCAALQVIAIYFSGSRGPWLGWGTSLVILWLGLSLIWRKRWLTWSGVALAILAGSFLVILNIPNGPLESLRNRPEFGRLGQLLDAESRTGKVRSLIWQGASELVQLSQPLEYPDGRTDSFSFLRPWIGYGPEAMYVAYNRIYPPELTQVEKRNASPDRAHNESWDAMVMTGGLGLVAYLALFGSVIYFGLKWLGFIVSRKQHLLFIGLYLAGGLVSSLLFGLWQGLAYLGVALPFGMILGVVVYLLISSAAGWIDPVETPQEKLRAYLLLGFVAAIVAHFMEINFGIAIAASRTYFWIYAALLCLVGIILPARGEFQPSPAGRGSSTSNKSLASSSLRNDTSRMASPPDRKEGRGERRSSEPPGKGAVLGAPTGRRKRTPSSASTEGLQLPELSRETFLLGLILSILLIILGYDFITNSQRETSIFQVIWTSFIRLKAVSRTSMGILALLGTTWVVGAVVLVSEFFSGEQTLWSSRAWARMLVGVLAISITLAGAFWVLHASGLVGLARTNATNIDQVLDQVRRSETLIQVFYLALLMVVAGIAYLISAQTVARQSLHSPTSGILAAVVLVASLALSGATNLKVVQADIAFKTAELFAQPNSWPVAIAIYNRANQLAPKEDYYYLFLGRAYLEYAKTLSSAAESDALIQQAALDLMKAQDLNPLNTDHTANLARLYSLWAGSASDQQTLNERAALSEAYFARAVTLSPNNARLWDEWAMLYLNVLDNPALAYEKLQAALQLDPTYDWTYALLGDYYSRYVAIQAKDDLSMQQALQESSAAYSKALELAAEADTTVRFTYALALGSVQTRLNQIESALSTYALAYSLAPEADQWRVDEAMAHLFLQVGDLQNALSYANKALQTAPAEAQERLQQLLAQISG